MRVEARGEVAAATRARATGFEAALRRAVAERAGGEASRRQGRREAGTLPGSPADERARAEPGREAAGAGGASARGGGGDGPGAAPGDGEPRGDREPGGAIGGGGLEAAVRGRAEAAGSVPIPLARAVAQVAPAVEAFWREGRAALSLDFGRALGLELRSEGGAVALELHAPPDLLASARAAVPGLVAAVAARGVPVMRVEVRQRGEEMARRRR